MWKPSVFGGAPSEQAAINHGTYFYWASQECLIKNGSSIASVPFPFPSFIHSFLFLLNVRFDPSLSVDFSMGPFERSCPARLTMRMMMHLGFRG